MAIIKSFEISYEIACVQTDELTIRQMDSETLYAQWTYKYTKLDNSPISTDIINTCATIYTGLRLAEVEAGAGGALIHGQTDTCILSEVVKVWFWIACPSVTTRL